MTARPWRLRFVALVAIAGGAFDEGLLTHRSGAVVVLAMYAIGSWSEHRRWAVAVAGVALALAVAGDGVTVNTVQPGLHATDRVTQLYGPTPDATALGIPAGVIGDPGDFGQAVAFLCSEHARFVTGAAIQWLRDRFAGKRAPSSCEI